VADVALTEATAAAPARSRSPLALFVAVLLIPAVLIMLKDIFADGDVSWHIAAGQWILDHHAIPHVDPFSFTALGKPWVPIEWLAEVIYASAYRLAGYGGLAAVVMAGLMILQAIVYFNAVRWTRFELLPIIAMDFVLPPMLLARPHVLTWPLLAFWTWLMLRARGHGRAPPIVAALLMTMWANLHGSFVIGLAIAAAFALEALVSSADKKRAFTQWLLFGIACLIAVCINANGFAGLRHPFYMAGQTTLTMVDEWKPSNPSVTPFFFGVLGVTIALIAWKRPRLHGVRWLLLVGLLGLALYQVRHQAMLAIVAAMLLPQGFARTKEQSAAENRALRWIIAGGAALLVIARAIMPLSPPENEANPWHLIAAIPPQLRSEPVLNGYSMGGPLILSGIRPYIDGRADMYGDAFVVDYSHIAHGDAKAFTAAVQRWNIRWAMLPNRDKGLIALLDRSPGWRRIAHDQAGVIYVRSAS
jgi:hypothetical protein